MFFYFMSFLSLSFGIYGFIFTLKNKNDMPFGIFGFNKAKFIITNKNKFNKIMVVQSFSISIYLMLLSPIIFISKSTISCMCLSFVVLLSLLFANLAKKYLKINPNN